MDMDTGHIIVVPFQSREFNLESTKSYCRADANQNYGLSLFIYIAITLAIPCAHPLTIEGYHCLTRYNNHNKQHQFPAERPMVMYAGDYSQTKMVMGAIYLT